MTSTKRTIAMILAAALALSLLLTACGNGGDTPTGDNPAPGVSDTPDNTPGATDPSPDGGGETPERGTRPAFGAAEKPSYTQANVYGNTNGNIGNLGYAAIQGDWIYYQNVNHDMLLYAMKTDGSCNQKLSNDVPLFINVVGDWVYYIDALAIQDSGKKTNQMYKVNIDGSGRQRICEDSVDYITVVGDSIYYCNYDDDFKLYTIKTDGTGRKKLSDDLARFPVVSGDSIYYSDGDNLYAIQTDGTGRRILIDHSTTHINVEGNTVYYARAIDFMEETIWVRNTDGSGLVFGEDLYYHNARFFNVSGGKIYYGETGSDGLVAVMNTDTSGLEVFDSELYAQHLNVVGDWIFYLGGDSGALYAIKTDGTGNRLAGGPPETSSDITIPEADMVSVAGVYYQGEQLIYCLPEGLTCFGLSGFEGSYVSTWAKNLKIDYSTGVVTVDEIVQIIESSEKIADFDTRTAEQWYAFGAEGGVQPESVDIKMEKTTVDGCRAVKLSFADVMDGKKTYTEKWVLDTPNGNVMISASVLDTLVQDAGQFSQWVAVIISNVWINR